MVIALAIASPVFASEITGTLTAGTGSTVGGTVIGPPTASPLPGTYGGPILVSLTSPGASSIRYTIDGSAPSCAGGGFLYIGPINVPNSMTIQAISCYSSGGSSSVGFYGYVISGGTLSGTVTMSSGGSLSGTVVSPPGGGTLSGSVVAPPSGGGGGGGGSSGGGGGGNGPPIAGTGGGGGSPGGSVLGASTDIPNVPNAGASGNAAGNLLTLTLSALAALSGLTYLTYRLRSRS